VGVQVHERSVDADLVFAVLRQLKRKQILGDKRELPKIVLMSATYPPKKLNRYFQESADCDLLTVDVGRSPYRVEEVHLENLIGCHFAPTPSAISPLSTQLIQSLSCSHRQPLAAVCEQATQRGFEGRCDGGERVVQEAGIVSENAGGDAKYAETAGDTAESFAFALDVGEK